MKTLNINLKGKNKIYENIIYNNILKAKSNINLKDENDNPILLKNQNNIKSINIINNNYNNIIINNKLTPNKKLILKDKTFSISRKNYKILTTGNKQKNLKNKVFKLTLNNQEFNKDIEAKYKLILEEKNNLINNLKNEIELYKYKNNSHSPNITNNNINSPISNNKANYNIDNIRNKIQAIFSKQNKEIKNDNNNLINNSKNIKEFNLINENNHTNSSEEINFYMPQIYQGKPMNSNSLEQKKSFKLNNKLLFNYSLKNNLKLKNKLTLDLSNNYNSIENNTNRIYNYSLKSPKLLFSSNSINKNLELNEYNNFNYKLMTHEDKIDRRKPSLKNMKSNNYYYNNILSSPFSLKKEIINKNTIVNHNLDSFFDKDNENEEEYRSSSFNYKEKYDDLRNRMINLIENLFKLIECKK